MRYPVFEPEVDGQPLLQTVKYVHQITGHVADVMLQDHDFEGSSPADRARARGLELYHNLQVELATTIWDHWTKPQSRAVPTASASAWRRDRRPARERGLAL